MFFLSATNWGTWTEVFFCVHGCACWQVLIQLHQMGACIRHVCAGVVRLEGISLKLKHHASFCPLACHRWLLSGATNTPNLIKKWNMGGGAFQSTGQHAAGLCVLGQMLPLLHASGYSFAADFAHSSKTIDQEVNHTPNTFPLILYWFHFYYLHFMFFWFH